MGDNGHPTSHWCIVYREFPCTNPTNFRWLSGWFILSVLVAGISVLMWYNICFNTSHLLYINGLIHSGGVVHQVKVIATCALKKDPCYLLKEEQKSSVVAKLMILFAQGKIILSQVHLHQLWYFDFSHFPYSTIKLNHMNNWGSDHYLHVCKDKLIVLRIVI